MANRTVATSVALLSLVLLCPTRPAGGADGGPRPVKPPLAGLVDMGDIGFHRQDGGRAEPHADNLRRFPGVLGGVVVNITWEQLEPERGGPLKTDAIDRVLADVRADNAATPSRPAGTRLRVWPGPNAPAWAKRLGGPPVALLHKGRRMTVGRFWAQPYRDAWRDLQHRLAARYDAEPLVREVTNTSG